MPGSIASSDMIRHSVTLTPKIALIESRRAVRQLVGDESDEGGNVAVEIEQRAVVGDCGLGRTWPARFPAEGNLAHVSIIAVEWQASKSNVAQGFTITNFGEVSMSSTVSTTSAGPGAAVPRLSLDPFSIKYFDDLDRSQEVLREAGPLVYLDKWNVSGVARYAEVHAVMNDPATVLFKPRRRLERFREGKAMASTEPHS